MDHPDLTISNCMEHSISPKRVKLNENNVHVVLTQNVHISVFKGTDLPGLDASGLSDPYVEVSLQPHNWFGAASKIQKTAILKNTLNPTFNTEFQL